jgi:hypothetical protein
MKISKGKSKCIHDEEIWEEVSSQPDELDDDYFEIDITEEI